MMFSNLAHFSLTVCYRNEGGFSTEGAGQWCPPGYCGFHYEADDMETVMLTSTRFNKSLFDGVSDVDPRYTNTSYIGEVTDYGCEPRIEGKEYQGPNALYTIDIIVLDYCKPLECDVLIVSFIAHF